VATVGLILQVVGVVIAGVALAVESRSHSQVRPQTLSTQRKRRLVNPWRKDTGVKYERPNRLDRDEYKEWLRGRSLSAQTTSMRSDPEVLALGEYLLTQQREREALLADDWVRQVADDDAVRAELKRFVRGTKPAAR
jgi:hypothetical protein